jgi:ribosomal protein S14
MSSLYTNKLIAINKALYKIESRKRFLKWVIYSDNFDEHTRLKAVITRAELSPIYYASKIKRRCFITHRGRGLLRKYGLSRIEFKRAALAGELPGVRKVSW